MTLDTESSKIIGPITLAKKFNNTRASPRQKILLVDRLTVLSLFSSFVGLEMVAFE